MKKTIIIFLIILNIALFKTSNFIGKAIKNDSINKEILKTINNENKRVDILKLSLLLSKEIFPKIEINKYSNDINKMIKDVNMIINKSEDPLYKIGVVNDYLYKTIGFKYDMNDLGARLEKNQFITGYLDSKEGSCITMPLLFYIIASKLSFPIMWVRAPDHFFCRYYIDDNSYINIESTSQGMTTLDEVYIEDFKITEEELNSKIYMYSLTERECSGDLLCITGTYFARKKDMNKAIDYFNASLMLDPNNSFTYRFLSLIYKNLGEEDKSKEYLDKAVALGYKEIKR